MDAHRHPSSGSEPISAARNIHDVVELEEQFERDRPASGKVADGIAAFVGSIPFVLIHLAVLAVWIAVNLGAVPGVKPFDPFPFQLLCMIVSIEGVLLSTFVLIKQNRMSLRSDRRAHLDLQINLLSEREITKAIEMLERLSKKLGIAGDPEIVEFKRHTAVKELARELNAELPRE